MTKSIVAAAVYAHKIQKRKVAAAAMMKNIPPVDWFKLRFNDIKNKLATATAQECVATGDD